MDHQNAETESAQDLHSAKNNSTASDRNGDQALNKIKTDTPTNRIEEDTAIVSLVVSIFDGNQHLSSGVPKRFGNKRGLRVQ